MIHCHALRTHALHECGSKHSVVADQEPTVRRTAHLSAYMAVCSASNCVSCSKIILSARPKRFVRLIEGSNKGSRRQSQACLTLTCYPKHPHGADVVRVFTALRTQRHWRQPWMSAKQARSDLLPSHPIRQVSGTPGSPAVQCRCAAPGRYPSTTPGARTGPRCAKRWAWGRAGRWTCGRRRARS